MEKYSRASIQAQISLSVLNTGQALIMAIGLGAVMALAAAGIKSGQFTVGTLVAANAILVQLYIPLNLLGTVYREITQALVDMEAMFRLLNQPQEVKDKPDAKPLVVMHGEIRFDNVVFSYEPARTVLKGISFVVPAGKTVAVVGPSGAGKSTISRILYRFYDIKSGSVTIDGQDIRDVTQESLRAVIGIVPQDTVLFNDTVRYNIAYGRIGANEAEIKEAARHAQIDKFIVELPLGYDAMVGERGLKLSGGEKQRVAIARTILKNPPILLLDEATSALDTGTEREIQSALNEISRDRTALVIAHRLSTVVDADEILVLDHGEIIERGRHDELVAARRSLRCDVEQAEGSRRCAREAQGSRERSRRRPEHRPDSCRRSELLRRLSERSQHWLRNEAGIVVTLPRRLARCTPLADAVGQGQHRRHQPQRDQLGEGEAEHDRRGKLHPHHPVGTADGDFAAREVDLDREHHRQQAADRRDGRQEHRPQALGAGADHRLDRVHAGVAQAVERVDQHDVVVHHDAGQRQHAGTRHDDRERLSHHDHAEQRADHGEDDGDQDQRGVIEAVEQHQQNHRDQEQGEECGLQQEQRRIRPAVRRRP